MTTGKTIALTRWTFVGKIMSLLLNMLSRLVITLLPGSKRLLSSWLQSPSAVILEPRNIKPVTVSTVSPSICHEWWDQMPWSLFSECWALSQLFHCPLSLSSRCWWTGRPGVLQFIGLQTVGHDWATSLSLFIFTHWRRKWQPTPLFLPGESQGWGSLVGCRLWGRTESDTTEVT